MSHNTQDLKIMMKYRRQWISSIQVLQLNNAAI